MKSLISYIKESIENKKHLEELKDYPEWIQYLGYLQKTYRKGNHKDAISYTGIQVADFKIEGKHINSMSLNYVFGEDDKEISKLEKAADSSCTLEFFIRINGIHNIETTAEVKISKLSEIESELKANLPKVSDILKHTMDWQKKQSDYKYLDSDKQKEFKNNIKNLLPEFVKHLKEIA